jgi:hypothetical protein
VGASVPHFLAPQVTARGITVSVLAPAIVGEDSIAPLGEEAARAMIARIPVGRAGGTDEAVAMAVSILANAYLTNKVITLDGGFARADRGPGDSGTLNATGSADLSRRAHGAGSTRARPAGAQPPQRAAHS